MNNAYKKIIKSQLSPFNVIMTTQINGQRFKVPVMRGIGASNLKITELWMVDALKRLLSLAPGTAFVDIGVNLGQSLLKVKSLDRYIPHIGFDPNPFCVQYVQEMIRVNGFPNCELIPTGLADKAGLVVFIADSEADTAGSIIRVVPPVNAMFFKQVSSSIARQRG